MSKVTVTLELEDWLWDRFRGVVQRTKAHVLGEKERLGDAYPLYRVATDMIDRVYNSTSMHGTLAADRIWDVFLAVVDAADPDLKLIERREIA
jgi:hypothetical protein